MLKFVNDSTRSLILSSISVALIILGSFIKIPLPFVPITLQFFFVLLTAHWLRPFMAGVTLTVYLLLGLIGLPVFSGGGGIGYVLHPTFGYLIGFLFGAVIVSAMAHNFKNPTFFKLVFCNFIGYLVIYIFGLSYYVLLTVFYLKTVVDFWQVLAAFWLVFLLGDIISIGLSAIVSLRLKPFLKRK